MKQDYPIEVLCEAFCVSRGGYYEWRERANHPSPRAQEDQELAEQIREVHQQSRGTYGTPHLQAELRERGRCHSRKRIDRLRRQLGLCGRQKRRYRPRTTDSHHAEPIAPNRLAELPQATRRDQISRQRHHLPAHPGRLVVLGRHHGPLQPAHHRLSPSPITWAANWSPPLWRWPWCTASPRKARVHHSDRGVQYASAA
jgi:putative transposase